MTRLLFVFRMWRLWLAIKVRDRMLDTIAELTPSTTPRPCSVEACSNTATQHVRVSGSGKGGGRRRVVVALCESHRIYDTRRQRDSWLPAPFDEIGLKP